MSVLLSISIFVLVAGAVYWIGQYGIPRYLRGRRRLLDRRARADAREEDE